MLPPTFFIRFASLDVVAAVASNEIALVALLAVPSDPVPRLRFIFICSISSTKTYRVRPRKCRSICACVSSVRKKGFPWAFIIIALEDQTPQKKKTMIHFQPPPGVLVGIRKWNGGVWHTQSISITF